MYTEKQIQLVMWMPKPTDSDEYCHLVLDTLRNLMDVCKENVSGGAGNVVDCAVDEPDGHDTRIHV